MEKRTRKTVARELPPVGTKLLGKLYKKNYSAVIVRDETTSSGRAVRYDHKNYRSMTAAAKKITNNPVNGWKFWKTDK